MATHEALSCDREQFGRGRFVPVRIGDLDVSNVGRKGKNAAVDVQSTSVPIFQSMAHERMSEVVHPRRRMIAASVPLQSRPQYLEGVFDASCGRWPTVVEHEKCVGITSKGIAVAVDNITSQRVCRSGMHRNPSRFAKLGAPNMKQPLLERDVRTGQCGGFRDTKAGGCNQSEDRLAACSA